MNGKKIGKYIKELRQKNGLSQSDLAKKVFVSREAISKWENGKSIPNYESLNALSNCFSVTKASLINGECFADIKDGELLRTLYDDDVKKHNELKKRTKLFLTVIGILFIFLFGFLVYYFFNSYDSVKVYKIVSEDSKIHIQDGLFVITKDKYYFRLGNILESENRNIEYMKVYFKEINENNLIYANSSDEDPLIIDYNGYCAFFDLKSMSLKTDKFYLVYKISSEEKIAEIKLEEDYSNKHLFFKKIEKISKENKIRSLPIPKSPAMIDKIKLKFEDAGEDNYYYFFEKDGINYTAMFRAYRANTLNINWLENSISYSFDTNFNTNEVEYIIYDEINNQRDNSNTFKYNEEHVSSNDIEKKYYDLLESIFKEES